MSYHLQPSQYINNLFLCYKYFIFLLLANLDKLDRIVLGGVEFVFLGGGWPKIRRKSQKC